MCIFKKIQKLDIEVTSGVMLMVLICFSIDRTYKMYYGGAQKRPDSQYSRPVINPSGKVVGHVGEGNRKDVRNAVEAAHGAAAG